MAIMTTLMLLAAVMMGETEVLDSDAAALAIFEVAMNRVRDDRFPDDLHTVLLEGFNGWRRVKGTPDARYIRLACRALAGEHRWDHGGLYMLSWDDLVELGGVNQPPLKVYRNGRWAVYLFADWPR